MSKKTSPFSPTVIGFVIAGVVAIFALSVLLLAVGGGSEPGRSKQASASAIGHLGFYTLLEKLDIPVSNDRLEGDDPVGRGGVLVLDEPDLSYLGRRKSLKIDTAKTVLIVLPKRWGSKDPDHDGWIAKDGLLPLERPQNILDLVLEGATVSRAASKMSGTSQASPAGTPAAGKGIVTNASPGKPDAKAGGRHATPAEPKAGRKKHRSN